MKVILYKTRNNSSGEDTVQVWKVEVLKNVMLIQWGVKNGKMQIKKQVFESGKQKRSAAQQALFEAESLVKKKMKQGYATSEQLHKNQGECPQGSPLPMLAHTYNHDEMVKRKITNIALQPKLDGIRCLANTRTGELWSRKQTRILGLEHIENEIKTFGTLMDSKDQGDQGDIWLDGELYNHSMTFNEICSSVRKTANFNKSQSAQIEYWVYDCICPPNESGKSQSFVERYELLSQTWNAGQTKFSKLVDTTFRKYDEKSLKAFHDKVVKDNYEGAIVRSVSQGYDIGKRSKQLLKYKAFKQEEFVITGCILRKNTNPNKPEDTLGSFELITENHEVKFQASFAGTEKEKMDIWNNQNDYIGQIATVKFFEYTPAGIPRFPVVLGFRHPHDM